MPIPILYEAVSSRPLSIADDAQSLVAHFIAVGSTSELDVYSAALVDTPRSYFNLYRNSIKCMPRGGGPYWDVEVEYTFKPSDQTLGDTPEEPEAPDAGDPLPINVSISTGGGTTKITQSIATVSTTQIGGIPAVNNHQAIGATRESVEGTEVVSPDPKWTIEVKRPAGQMTLQYYNILYLLTGTVNNAVFYNHGIGECLFLGATGKATAGDTWTLTYEFDSSATRKNLVVSDEITVPEKRGWDYLWVGYGLDEPVAGQVARRKPNFASVEQVYRYTNFRLLGIGA